MAKQVSSRLLLNSLLLIVVAILVYFIGYQPIKQRASAQQSLFSIATYQATGIHIQRPDKTAVTLIKKSDKWALIEPAIAAVNGERIKHLLTILQEPVIATYDPAGMDMSQFGLAPGKIKLRITSTDHAEEITFGSTNSVTLNRYILKNNTIHTINEIVYGVLGSSVTQLLAHRLLPDYAEIVSIDAPKLLARISPEFWHNVEAKDIADYNGDETIIGKIKLTIQKAQNMGGNKTEQVVANQNETQSIVFNILAIKPSLILARPDLNVKYTFDENVMKMF